MAVHDPASPDQQIAQVAVSNKADVDKAVSAAAKAFSGWSRLTIKTRATMMLKLHALIRNNAQELAELIVKENGKNITEALADVAKGNETVEWACSLPQLAQGNIMRVSTGVTCMDRKDPIGVVASIVPFNFPLMVPMVCDIMMMSCHAMSCLAMFMRCTCSTLYDCTVLYSFFLSVDSSYCTRHGQRCHFETQ